MKIKQISNSYIKYRENNHQPINNEQLDGIVFDNYLIIPMETELDEIVKIKSDFIKYCKERVDQA
jgi:hypothetical protein